MATGSIIRCRCGFKLFDGVILRIRVGQFSGGFMNLKCPRCRIWVEGISMGYLTGEIDGDYISKERRSRHE